MANGTSAPSPAVVNAQNRAIVLGSAVPMTQRIFTTAVDPDNNPIINVPLRNVGLILGLTVIVNGGVTNGAVNQADRTNFGSANAVRNFTFTDLNNVQRINTTGLHITLLNALRAGFPYGSAFAPNLPMDFGNNWAIFQATTPLAAAAVGTVRHVYYLPIAYAKNDLRGGIYSNVVNATQNLQITLTNSAQLGVAAGTDPLQAVYSGNDNIAWTDNVTVTVYQHYLDQIPMVRQNGMAVPVLPIDDLNTIYDLKYTSQVGMVANQEFPVPYANYRQFLSTIVIYDNGGTYNVGSDINRWKLQAANSVNLFDVDPQLAALVARQLLMTDPPDATYIFDSRDKPIDTLSYGNMQLILDASTVNANAQLIVMYEAFQQVTQIPVAGSLAAG